jgi:capsular exopolysaccharide synthesis family protein
MSRLNEAFEKAAGTRAANRSDRSAVSQLTDTTSQVPQAWDFDLSGDSPQGEAPAHDSFRDDDDRDAPDPRPVSAAEYRVDPRTADAHRERDADVWKAYKFGGEAQSKVVVGEHANSALVEQYRRLGAALHHHQLQGAAHTLMVTSAVASEGKTLTATNLALTLSHSYKRRVLLIDADLRRPSIHEVLSLPNTIGLTDKLRSPDQTTLTFQTVSPLLSVLTAGRPDSDPMAGLVSQTMSKILADAAEQFDWVIVDTPPVALLPDANLLAAMIDTAILVVSANATPYPLVARAVQAIGEQRILGVVLNRMAHAEMIGSYNYYGYGGYYYYGGNRAKPSLLGFLPFFGRKKPKEVAGDVRE